MVAAAASQQPVVVWGAGAVGGTLAAHWVRAGHDVLLVDNEANHVAACRESGLAIDGPIAAFRVTVPALTPAELAASGVGPFRHMVLAVKAQHTAAAVASMQPHLADDGYVVSAQNGLNELTIAKVLGERRTLGCFVNFSADWHGPGHILYGNRGAVVVGEIDGRVRERTRAMHALLREFEPDAVLTEDIWAYLWGKMAYGAMLFATALTNDAMADNFAAPERRPLWIALAREVVAVAAARDVVPRGFNGFEPAAFAPASFDPEAAATSIARLADFNRDNAKTHSGVWRDLAVRKRKTEVDAQLGIIAELADQAGVETPLIRRLVKLIHDVEDGRREQSAATLRALAGLCKST